MATTLYSTPIVPVISRHFCCNHCGADMMLIEELGGDLAYECQNGACGWSGSVDCPEAFGLKPEGQQEFDDYCRDWDAEREATIADLEQYVNDWNAYAESLMVAVKVLTFERNPEPTPPASVQRARAKAEWYLAQGIKLVRVRGAWLVPSGTRSGTIHRVDDAQGCSCEASQNGRVCWHREAVAIHAAEVSPLLAA